PVRGLELVVLDELLPVVPHGDALVVLDEPALVLLRLHIEELSVFRVLEQELVEPAPARVRVALPGAPRFVLRQLVGHLVTAVEHPADQDRLVRVAGEEADEPLLADAGEVQRPEAGAGPALAHPHPRGAVVVALALAIPGELDAHAPELVGVYLLSRGA